MINLYLIKIFSYACCITISALGLNLIYGYTGLFSLGHAAFMGIGAYLSALITKSFCQYGYLIYFLAIIFSSIFTFLVSYLIAIPILKLKSDYLGIATLGFGIIVKVLLDNSDKIFPQMGGSRGMLGIPNFTNLPIAFFSLILIIIIMKNLISSKFGRSLLAIREDENAAYALGINVYKQRLLSFALGCAFAGFSGSLYAHLYCFLHPSNFDFLRSIDLMLIIVLGGLGSMSGTIIAAFLWVFILEGLRIILPQAILDWRLVIYPLLLILLMLLRPQGIFGNKEILWLKEKI
jgi:branched-chain amino acid transport system permease protein